MSDAQHLTATTMTVSHLIDAPTDFEVAQEVLGERVLQDSEQGLIDLPDGTGGKWLQAVADETRNRLLRGKAAGAHSWRNILYDDVASAIAAQDEESLYEGLLHAAATAQAWAAAIKRRRRAPKRPTFDEITSPTTITSEAIAPSSAPRPIEKIPAPLHIRVASKARHATITTEGNTA